MTTRTKVIIGILLLPLSPFIIWFGYAIIHGVILLSLGYYVDVEPTSLAERLISEGKPPQHCRYLAQAIPTMGPSIVEKRQSCIYEYAKLSHDPTACELLLPNPYGWSCVGAAQKIPNYCTVSYGIDVSWGVTDDPYESPQKATLTECEKDQVTSRKGKECCYLLRVTAEEDLSNCSVFEKGSPQADQCFTYVASKLNQMDKCDSVHDENARTICKLYVKYK